MPRAATIPSTQAVQISHFLWRQPAHGRPVPCDCDVMRPGAAAMYILIARPMVLAACSIVQRTTARLESIISCWVSGRWKTFATSWSVPPLSRELSCWPGQLPSGVMTRTVRELGSVTRMEQLLRQATPSIALEKSASDASPSVSPGCVHWPARVSTSPAQEKMPFLRDLKCIYVLYARAILGHR